MIILENVSRTFHTGDSLVNAIDNVSLSINDNEFIAIVGRSGSGKSTLMNLIGALDQVDSGKIIVNGTDITTLNSKELANYRLVSTGFIFQAFHLEPMYTVYDNIRIALMIADVPYKIQREKIISVLQKVDLEDKINVKISKLSGGERQRVTIARAIVNNAPIILADEPCGNLDSVNSSKIMELLKVLHNSGKTVILVTHNIIDAKIAERIIELKDGKVVKDETANEFSF
ncbi:MAG: ABC transporter ATP-binding protein [Clostridiales bacterium]|nr:ABC transporter ATP-binding protein [Clostridiales bacterium]